MGIVVDILGTNSVVLLFCTSCQDQGERLAATGNTFVECFIDCLCTTMATKPLVVALPFIKLSIHPLRPDGISNDKSI
jgi:hypothetical protein